MTKSSTKVALSKQGKLAGKVVSDYTQYWFRLIVIFSGLSLVGLVVAGCLTINKKIDTVYIQSQQEYQAQKAIPDTYDLNPELNDEITSSTSDTDTEESTSSAQKINSNVSMTVVMESEDND